MLFFDPIHEDTFEDAEVKADNILEYPCYFGYTLDSEHVYAESEEYFESEADKNAPDDVQAM